MSSLYVIYRANFFCLLLYLYGLYISKEIYLQFKILFFFLVQAKIIKVKHFFLCLISLEYIKCQFNSKVNKT